MRGRDGTALFEDESWAGAGAMAVNFKPHEGAVAVCLGSRITTTEALSTNSTGLELAEVTVTGSIWKTESESDTAAAGADGG